MRESRNQPANRAAPIAVAGRTAATKEAAAQLDISTSTVRAHLHTIYGKLHAQSRTEAVVKFLGR